MCVRERGIQGKQCDPFTIATAFIQEQCVSVSLTVPLQREQGQLLTQATTGTSSHISLHGGACIPTSKVGAWWFFCFLGRLFSGWADYKCPLWLAVLARLV